MFATFAWQFLPEFVFPMVAYLAPLCWFASRNSTVNFLGSGKGGIGLLNITLDWSNITSTVITYPYSVQVTIFVGFVITVSLPAILRVTVDANTGGDLDTDSCRLFLQSMGFSNLRYHVKRCLSKERVNISSLVLE